jgi:AsmA family protein
MPTWHVRAVTNDATLGHIWQQLQTEVPLEGNLDLDLDLQARGSSPRAMAASLEGDLGLSIQRGRINSRLFALTTMSPFGWLFAKSTRRGYSKFDCFIARFHAKHGLAELQSLVLDTPDAIATGTGSIDFAREMINLQIHPRAKHRSFGAPAAPFAIVAASLPPRSRSAHSAQRHTWQDRWR